METLNIEDVQNYVNENIVDFHQRRIKSLETLTLEKLIRKNPYLFKAKHITTASALIDGFMEAFLSSSEEKLFGDFLEGLAIFVAEKTSNGHKSASPGVDLEFVRDKIHYIVSIKSGPNWGNSSQQKKLAQDLQNAVRVVKQGNIRSNPQAVLGICYGKTRTSFLRGYLKVVGQNFWTLISGNKNLYTEIIEPIGFQAKRHNEKFAEDKGKIANKLSLEFLETFCTPDGAINWEKLVEWNSGNFDLNRFFSP